MKIEYSVIYLMVCIFLISDTKLPIFLFLQTKSMN